MSNGYVAAASLWLALLLTSAVSSPLAYAACDPFDPEARPGCCSHHGGVCGCNTSTGMQKCCDGKDSPSCRCGE